MTSHRHKPQAGCGCPKRRASASLEETDTQIQAVSCRGQEHNYSNATNHGDQISSEAGLRFGGSLRGNLRGSLHDNLRLGDPRGGAWPAHTSVNEFMQVCGASLINEKLVLIVGTHRTCNMLWYFAADRTDHAEVEAEGELADQHQMAMC